MTYCRHCKKSFFMDAWCPWCGCTRADEEVGDYDNKREDQFDIGKLHVNESTEYYKKSIRRDVAKFERELEQRRARQGKRKDGDVPPVSNV